MSTMVKKFNSELGFIRSLYGSVIDTQRELANVIGVSYRTMHRWISEDDVTPSRLALERIRELEEVFENLRDALPERAIDKWLNSYNRVLGGEKPIDLLLEGKIREVHDAVIDLRDNIL